jgi:hypothetical protein
VAASQLPTFNAQLLEGPEIEVVNASKTGVLTRSQARLVPGAMIGLRVLTADESFVMYGRVVRSSLLSIADGVALYESALAFSSDFPLLSEDRVHFSTAEPGAFPDSPTPNHPFPREIGRLTGDPVVLTVTTFAGSRREDVLKALDVAD